MALHWTTTEWKQGGRPVLGIEAYQPRYLEAVAATARATKRGRCHEAGALARQIRWNPDRLNEYAYPLGMDMATTCCCHICVDDPNYEDHHVAFCIMHAAKEGHPDCLRLALLLARASFTQRKKINHLAWSRRLSLKAAN